MNKKERNILILQIKYELDNGQHTFTMCSCGRHGTRSEACWECKLERFM